MPRYSLLFVIHCTVLVPLTGAADETASRQPARVSPSVATFLQKHCVGCHGPDEQNASLRFDTMPSVIGDEAIAQRWQDILDVLNLDQMPPKEADQPSKEDLADMLETLTANLREAQHRLTDSGGQRPIE